MKHLNLETHEFEAALLPEAEHYEHSAKDCADCAAYARFLAIAYTASAPTFKGAGDAYKAATQAVKIGCHTAAREIAAIANAAYGAAVDLCTTATYYAGDVATAVPPLELLHYTDGAFVANKAALETIEKFKKSKKWERFRLPLNNLDQP